MLIFPKPGSKRKLGIVFGKILNNICEIRNALQDIDRLEFMGNRIVRNSVVLDMATIGELLKTITKNPDNESAANPDPYGVMKSFPDVRWKDIKGFRDIVSHRYFLAEFNMFWDNLPKYIDPLEKMICTVFEEVPDIKLVAEETIINIKAMEHEGFVDAENIERERSNQSNSPHP